VVRKLGVGLIGKWQWLELQLLGGAVAMALRWLSAVAAIVGAERGREGAKRSEGVL